MCYYEYVVGWLDYVKDELKKLSHNSGWIGSGTLDKHDSFTLIPCVGMFKHEAPARLAFER